MKRMAILVFLAMSASVFGNSNYVHWVGGTGDWMVPGNWQNEDPEPDWNIPGWVVGNPWNTGGSSALDWNQGRAVIESGTAQITPTSAPDGYVAKLYLGGTNGANVEISGDALFKDIYIADKNESATVTQTGGNVELSGNYTTHIGRSGNGTYNLSGGTLTHTSDAGSDTHTFIGVYNGAVGTFNQTGGTFTKNGTVQQNIVVGYAAGSKGTVNLSGGTFHYDVGDDMRLGSELGSQGYLNISDTASLRVGQGDVGSSEPPTGYGVFTVGRDGYGKVVQTGGAVQANYLKLGFNTSGLGDYVISGGSLDIPAYLYIPEAGTFMVSGSGADHIRMNEFMPNYQYVGFELDANGSTLIEVDGTTNDFFHGAYENARFQLDTLPDFNGQVGDSYDVLWSATPIVLKNYNYLHNVGTAIFERSIVATNGGEMVRFTMVGTKTNAVAWSGTGDWMDSSHWTDVDPSPNWTIPGQGPLNEGEALIRSGEASITASSYPDSPVVKLDLGSSAGATLNVTGGDVEFGNVKLAEAGQVATVNQSGGNVVWSGENSADTAYIGRYGHGIYNLSGGTLTHLANSTAALNTFIGVDRGSVGIFNQTGGTFVKTATDNSLQKAIYLGFYPKAIGIMNLSGGEFRQEVGSLFTLGKSGGSDLARGYLNLSGTALLQLGDGSNDSAKPATGYCILQVGDEGYGEINQTGGSLDTLYLKIADSTTTGEGLYTISGGSLDVHRYVYLINSGKATMTVKGSGADSLRMSRFIGLAGTTLNLQLDANGTTLMEVYGTSGDSYRDAVLRGTVAVDTLDSFNAPSGTVFDVIWSANNIETTSSTFAFTNLSDRATFDWQVVAKDNGGVPGQMLQLVVTSAKTPYDLWVEGYGLTNAVDAATTNDYDGDGLNNLYEFGLGGSPIDPLNQGISPTYGVTPGWLTYVYPQRSAYSGLNYYLELTGDLVTGTWTNSGYEVQGTGTINDDFDAVTNRVSTAVENEQFIRLIIEQ